jgi:hypothetical protein
LGGEAGGGPASQPAETGAEGPEPALALLDDLEGAFPAIIERDGRNGYWFSADDATGWVSALQRVEVLAPTADNRYAVALDGAGFYDWGALLGVTLVDPFAAYDGSAYCGVHFRARGSGAGWRLEVSDALSEPQGGLCDTDCYEHLGQPFQPGDSWQDFVIPFAALSPNGSAPARALVTSELYSIFFAFTNPEGAAFELAVDDLAFIAHGGCP